MKRGKDDDKVMGPMFPRLHVNDTEKGGPRAPPRNKMALYEQLSIPSQRFKSAAMPINANTTVIPAGSTSQGSGHESNTIYSHPVTPPRQAAEKSASYYYDSSASFLPPERKKHLEEDDFMVPIFTHPRVGQDRGDCFLSCSANTECSTKHRSNSDNEPKHILPVGQNTGQEVGNQNGERLRDFVGGREHSVKAVSKSSSVDKAEVALMQAGTSLCHSPADNTANWSSRLVKAGHMLPEHRGQSRINGGVLGDAILDVSTRVTSSGNPGPVYDFHPEDQQILDDSDSLGEKTCQSLPGGVADRDDDASETSMVDSVSAFELSPDDVVGIIGQKHFWKARRAIINQQRVFAVQVFELHRLIKVQRLIAGSPRLLLEDSMYLGKSRKGSSAKKLPVDYVAKGICNGSKLKIDSEKPSHKFECSAENTVGKASLSSVHNGSQLPSYKPLPTNSAAAAAATGDHATGSWCYHPPQGHQWLIPVMSPSEGLVYKPYPGPGFMASSCGGCWPPGLTPMMGSFFPPAYGIPSTHHYQGMGVPPFANPAGPQGYFPPHGMAVLNEGITGSVVDSRTHFGASRLHGQPPQFMANHDIQHQNSSNMTSQKNGATADVMTSHASRDGELQMSTASSPSEQVQRSGRGNMTEGSGVLPLFPTSPVVEAPSLTEPQEVDHPARVIKVVPHNGRSVTESVARIFQSIQEERKQYDSA